MDFNTSSSSSFTQKDFIELRAKFDALTPFKALVGLVCRPEFYDLARKVARDSSDYSLFGAVEVYVDNEQKESYIPFYNIELLSKHLKRNERSPIS